MNGIREKRVAGIAILGLACLMAAGCASPGPKPVRKPPEVVVPGVVGSPIAVPGSRGTAGNAGGPVVSARVRQYGAAGSRGVVLLGGWAPGGADNPVAAGALAYFRWLNARGGVYGREVSYRVLDDHGDVRIVPSLARQLVQGAAVFAVFGPADPAPNVTVARFLSSSGVPDVFAGSGCDCLNVPARLPEVFGWPLGDVREGKILGAYAARRFGAERVAVLYAPDGSGRAELAGFQHTAKARLAAREAVAGPAAAAAAVQAARRVRPGVVVVLAPAAVGAQVAAAMRAQKLGVQLVDGMAAAYDMAAVMLRAGQALTRQTLVTALEGMPQGPAAAPLAYSLTDHGGAAGAYMGVVHNGFVMPVAGVMVTGTSFAQFVTPWLYQPQSAPPAGIPPL